MRATKRSVQFAVANEKETHVRATRMPFDRALLAVTSHFHNNRKCTCVVHFGLLPLLIIMYLFRSNFPVRQECACALASGGTSGSTGGRLTVMIRSRESLCSHLCLVTSPSQGVLRWGRNAAPIPCAGPTQLLLQ